MMWHGSPLSDMERMAITSHLLVGHEVHLYAYHDVGPVPEGVVLKDAREIWPENEIFAYAEGGSFSAFSNSFRYALLYDKGNWWCDTDVICLRPFDFNEPYVFASERREDDPSDMVTTCVIKCPKESELMQSCIDRASLARMAHGERLKWGVIGPQLLSQLVAQHNLTEFAQSHEVFCPWHWWKADRDPLGSWFPPDLTGSYALHLWQEAWNRNDLDKNGTFPSNCLYERLKDVILRRGPRSGEQDSRHIPISEQISVAPYF